MLSLHESCKKQMTTNKNLFNATDSEWNDWQWQLKNRITTIDALKSVINLTDSEYSAINDEDKCLPMSITPYYATLLDRDNPNQPLRKAVIPTVDETYLSEGEFEDPLAEDEYSPVPGIVHRYPDRVLFLVTDFCSVYCRYCTRSRMVGRCKQQYNSVKQLDDAIAYIESNPNIRDVLLSGGDPLTMPEDRLEWILMKLKAIKHVEFIRIGTKVPAVLPQRVTDKLVNMLKRYHPLFISIHFTHPDELTPETKQACNRLADAGIPLGSQTVLLKGVNDNIDTLKSLFQGLLTCRVRPYYLYQCDPIKGSRHFRTSVNKGIEIIKGLRGHTTGYAVPTYVIDAPGGGGKIPIYPESIVEREGNNIILRNRDGLLFKYPDVV